MKLIYNATICNENKLYIGYIVIEGEYIKEVSPDSPTKELMDRADHKIDAQKSLVMPGVIDDQVHFREPGLTHKGDIRSESRAAVTGGVTSFMDMPNVSPPTTTIELLEEKYCRAAEVSYANYSFYLGATNKNVGEIEKINSRNVCGLKVFMGSSTGNMLVDDSQTLRDIFSHSPVLIATHCEEEAIIQVNLAKAKNKYGDNIPIAMHPVIRSAEACYASSSKAAELAYKYNAHLHILHLSTAQELSIFEKHKPLKDKLVTGEVCVHHLWFTDADYSTKGNRIKWNPAIKTAEDRAALRDAINCNLVDVVATDHAPHTIEEKNRNYLQAPSGAPFVQHSLAVMLEMARQGIFTVEKVVEMMCHRPAELFSVEKRGYLRAGYFADIVIVNRDLSWEVSQSNILYKCGWSPIEGQRLHTKVTHTFVNGEIAYQEGTINENIRGKRLTFARSVSDPRI